jgi:hypothetical protein
VGLTLTNRVALGTLLSTIACGAAGFGTPRSTSRIDYVDGAIEPVLVRGRTVVFEGFGFGDSLTAGSLRFGIILGGIDLATQTLRDGVWEF